MWLEHHYELANSRSLCHNKHHANSMPIYFKLKHENKNIFVRALGPASVGLPMAQGPGLAPPSVRPWPRALALASRPSTRRGDLVTWPPTVALAQGSSF